ncbi:MAG: deoxyribose-phosphate aldolase [Candidatus Cloacimonetes bacterium]|jgi:deoxyribose-phosphate aldolase|nr:deoxyribose-phosphate aldolase [Candidatus Cloacimonadota bacterium]MBT6994930.1 deoxyribose-phosphate aldolase [Candidatus Cloacimonadota bacterium]MBT7469056.1 deoxyribose-phosphate aldolase [Candidatus Cloacimonadota bacterium]
MKNLAKVIDHTELKANSGKEKIRKLCDEAKKYGFVSVCVNPFYVKYASEQLQNSNVIVCSVVGFPLGMNTAAIKAAEAKKAVAEGASEIDMVINVGAMTDGNYDCVSNEIRQVVLASKPAKVKVILETCYLTDAEIVKACQLAVEAGVHFVKTSTGFGSGGATEHHIKLMRKTVGENIGVKASGGVRTQTDAKKMIAAGASRIGASSSIKIVEG